MDIEFGFKGIGLYVKINNIPQKMKLSPKWSNCSQEERP